MGRRCSVESCLSDSSRPEDTGVTFHKVPLHSDIRPKWMSLCRIPDDKKDIKVIYICSRHFLNADFCNFKGKKYMLRQGVLPSVFPWNKLKKEFKKTVKSSEESDTLTTNEEMKGKPTTAEASDSNLSADEEQRLETQAESSTVKQEAKEPIHTSKSTINFAINEPIEALDFNQVWNSARIVEIDYEENEVLIHFDKCTNKPDEWICMDSARLRPLQPDEPKDAVDVKFELGERCMASWSDARKFPATVQKIIDEDTYEVLFDDGFVKVLKGHRMAKANSVSMQSSPLFLPVRGTKQDRRDKKRKLNVAALFGKKMKQNSPSEKKTSSPQRKATVRTVTNSPIPDDSDRWLPRWVNGKPVGEDSFIESIDGMRKSVVVADPRLPEGWKKHLAQRAHGLSAGKWDTIIVSPEGRKFRTRTEIRSYLENRPDLQYSDDIFDFALTSKRTKKKPTHTAPVSQTPSVEAAAVPDGLDTSTAENSAEEEGDNANSLKIPMVDDAFKCPIDGCGKSFRKENLAQMHVKHYHPEYTKFLDFTPNVADLAYARTVGEALDKSPGPSKTTPTKPPLKQTPSKPATASKPQSPTASEVSSIPSSPSKTNKDSEIIKLLSSKPFDTTKPTDDTKSATLPSGLPPNMYPDIKLRDLLSRSEGIPKRDDLNLKTLSASTHRPTGIKTLLPVVRVKENKSESGVPMDIDSYSSQKSHHFGNKIHAPSKHGVKRKRHPTESFDTKPKELQEITHASQELQTYPQQQGNVIIEGGEVIKIVRMKREEIINCTCGITEEDGLMIQCELCLCWQHAYCNNIERENQVPEKYICYICQNPIRQRSSKKYFQDQDWLKLGTLPTGSYHSKDEEGLNKRFEKLKKSHDISGGLLELKDYVHTLKVKIKIAGTKNHPKLYQWIKPWDKPLLPEKIETVPKEEPKTENVYKDQKNGVETKSNYQGESMLLSMLNEAKEEQKIKDEFSGFPIEQQVPNIPQPEAAMDPTECRLNLLDHIAHSQSLVEERLDDFEEQINALEDDSMQSESDENYPRMRQTLQMLMKDLSTLKDFSQIPTI